MSSYPPGGDYDERLLDNAPKATRLEKQEGYNVNLLASDTSETPMNARPPATVDGHGSLEAGGSPTKEGFTSPYSVPWYRQKKWRIIMLVVAIIIIGAIVGGVAGGVLSSKKKHNNSAVTPPKPTSSTSSTSGASAQSTAINGGPLPGSSTTPPTSESTNGAGTVPTGVNVGDARPPDPTTPVVDGNTFDGLKVAPIAA